MRIIRKEITLKAPVEKVAAAGRACFHDVRTGMGRPFSKTLKAVARD